MSPSMSCLEYATHPGVLAAPSHLPRMLISRPGWLSVLGRRTEVPTTSSAIVSPSCNSFWSATLGPRQFSCWSTVKVYCREVEESSTKRIPQQQGTLLHGEFHIMTIQSTCPRSSAARSLSHAFIILGTANRPSCSSGRDESERRCILSSTTGLPLLPDPTRLRPGKIISAFADVKIDLD